MQKSKVRNFLIAGASRQEAQKYLAAVFSALEANPAISFTLPPSDPIAHVAQKLKDHGRDADLSEIERAETTCTLNEATLQILCAGFLLNAGLPEDWKWDNLLILADTDTWHHWDRLIFSQRNMLASNASIALLVTDRSVLVDRILKQNRELTTSSQVLLVHDSFRKGRPVSTHEIDIFDRSLRQRLKNDPEHNLLSRKIALLPANPQCRWFSCDVFQGEANDYGHIPVSVQDAYEEAFLWLLAENGLYPCQT